MTRNKILPYKKHLKQLARELRKKCTYGENRLWQYIRNKKLGVEFHRQVPVDKYIVDFLCHELKLVVEIDGMSHEDRGEADRNRQEQLEDMGLHFARYTEYDVMKNIEGVLHSLKETIQKLSSSYPPSKGDNRGM